MSELAARQDGLVSYRQLLELGLDRRTPGRWVASGRLHIIHPGVFAVGHEVIGERGQLRAALLWAGAGTGLSNRSAAWWLQLVDEHPVLVELAASRRLRSTNGILVRQPRTLEIIEYRSLPVTSVAQTITDLAGSHSVRDIRRMLAEADYRRMLDTAAILALIRRGKAGAGTVREALRTHLPELARARRELEKRFLELCLHYRVPIPEVNVKLMGLTPDMVWRKARLIVELDGRDGHDTEPQGERDARRDLLLRSAGWTVVRYRWSQVTREPEAVAADVLRLLAARTPGGVAATA